MTPRFLRPAALAVLAAIVVGLSSPLAAEEVRKSESARAFGPLEKSLLVPGWGQLSEKRYVEGALFLAAEALCVWGIFASDHRGNESYALYQNAKNEDEAVNARRLAEKYDSRRNQFLLGAASVWAANLLDIYLIVKHKGGRDTSLALKVSCAINTVGLTASCRY